MNFSFVHASDLHIDSPLQGLEKYEGAPVERIKSATRNAFVNLIEFCIEKKVDFLLLAGDNFDGDWKDHSTGLFFNSQINKLREHNINVYLIRGNHDAASNVTKNLPLPPNVYEFSTDKPETKFIEHLNIAIHGQGFANRAVTDNLAENYTQALSGRFNIGLLHTSLTGREGHDSYAPCTEDTLISKGYDYWALGHIHKREIICKNSTYIVYPGNLQGRHIKETGEKGCVLVEVHDGEIQTVEECILDVIRWSLCEVDVSKCLNKDEVYAEIKDNFEKELDKCNGKLLVIRVKITGNTNFHKEWLLNPLQMVEEIRSIALDVALNDIWIEKVKFYTSDIVDTEEVKRRNPVIEEIFQCMDELIKDEEVLAEVLAEFHDLRKLIPPSFAGTSSIQDIYSKESIDQYMEEIKEIILFQMALKEGVEK